MPVLHECGVSLIILNENSGGAAFNKAGCGAPTRILQSPTERCRSPTSTSTTRVGRRKMVVASAVDKEGEQIYPRKWNHDFIDLPVVEQAKQKNKTPKFFVKRDERVGELKANG